MHSLACARDGGTDDSGKVQIALGTRSGTDADGDVGLLHGTGVLVSLGVGDDGLDAHLAQGTHNAQRDLSPVGY